MYNNYKIIGLCVSKIHTDVIFTFIQKLNKALVPLNYRLMIFQTTSDLFNKTLNASGEVRVFELIPYDIVDCLIIYDEYLWDKDCVSGIISEAKKNKTPIVVVETDYEGCYTLKNEQNAGFEETVRHIIEYHGIADVCMISGYPDNFFCIEREAVFKKVLADNNIPLRDDMIYYGGLWYQPTEEVANEIINKGTLPKAIICINDFTAITICEFFANHGIHVPDDVIVTGFDGTEEAEFYTPSITTSKCDVDTAIEHLINLFREFDTDKTTPHKISAPFKLRPGASCGCGKNHVFNNVGKILKASDERLQGYIEIEQRLYDVTERLVLSNNLDLFLESLCQIKMYDLAVMVNKDFLSPAINPLVPNRTRSFDDEMLVILSNDGSGIDKLYAMNRRELTPNFDKWIDGGKPIIFSTLCFLGNPMGYIVFNYEISLNQYCLIPQYITSLNRIFGDYRNIRYLKHVADSMEELSCRDYMTNLFNRNGFYKHMDDFLMLAAHDADIVVATVDMDGLKKVNDTYGHDEGDYAITTIAQAIDEINVHHKIVARFGGDEFVLCAVMNDGHTEEDLKRLIRTNLDKLQDKSKPFTVTVSIGCSTYEKANFSLDNMIKESDDEMYVEKRTKPKSR